MLPAFSNQMKEKAETDIRPYGVRAGKINDSAPPMAERLTANQAGRRRDAARCAMMSWNPGGCARPAGCRQRRASEDSTPRARQSL